MGEVVEAGISFSHGRFHPPRVILGLDPGIRCIGPAGEEVWER